MTRADKLVTAHDEPPKDVEEKEIISLRRHSECVDRYCIGIIYIFLFFPFFFCFFVNYRQKVGATYQPVRDRIPDGNVDGEGAASE